MSSPQVEREVDTISQVPQQKRRFQEWWLSVLASVVVVGLAAGAIIFRRTITNFHGYGYAGAFLISFLAGSTVLVYVPGDPALFALGGVLNPWLVGLVGGIGEAIGEITGYLFGRGGRGFIHRTIETKFARLYMPIKTWVKRRGTLVIFLAATFFNPFYDMFGIAAGALGMPAWKFFAACTGGKIIKDTAIALLGSWGMAYILRWFGVMG